ncbi:2OG-Fe(II) oxygenase family protein [uncultured Algibacter sp.]|uniref:2OG-Fe(II) oxygenase family protein n=1 Tax=uncultured Algibacter sp. TaxID=298659 RepID=UPI00260AA2AA|nr:2OG-Fe(II) oxygenase family protein [uncultured Algibacter sp.]
MLLKHSFSDFLKQPEVYRKQFLQAYFNTGFDGYSYMGQKDSSNQYDTDLLHSFVLSEFSETEKFPSEFRGFFNAEWTNLISKIESIELNLIQKLNVDGLLEFYGNSVGHMLSCNYYPVVEKTVSTDALRLSKHIDVSLFTVFVFGIDEGFVFQKEHQKSEALFASDDVLIFPGYLLEYLTNGKYKALEHQVDFSGMPKERFSFAFFSIPKPDINIEFQGLNFSSETYFNDYLSLF